MSELTRAEKIMAKVSGSEPRPQAIDNEDNITAFMRALNWYNYEKDKKTALIFDLVDVFNIEKPKNLLYKHFLEREKFYNKRKYPYKVTKVNL